jgi:hypothetical protein
MDLGNTAPPVRERDDPFDLWLKRSLHEKVGATLDEEIPSDLLRLVCDSRSEGIVRLVARSGSGSLAAMTTSPNPYQGFRYPAEVIQHAVWLYHCFSLSLRDVELILAARGIVVTYESIREWGLRFGRMFANELKRRWPRPGDKWFLDEVFIRIRGKLHYLWRAVDQDGNVLDVLVQSRRNARAAKRFFRKLLKGLGTIGNSVCGWA